MPGVVLVVVMVVGIVRMPQHIQKAIPLLKIFINMIRLKDILKESYIDNKFQRELIDRINDEYREDYKSLTPQEINDGYCDIWASLFMERFGGDHQWSFDFPNDPNGHSWVKLGNKFYDAEMLNGTTELTNLPFFQRFIKKYGTGWLDSEFYTNIQKTKYDASGIDTPGNPNL
jgi:hypothetical protein